MSGERVDVRTPDGVMDLHVFHPGESGPPGESRTWPAVVFYMDAFGIRPNLAEMAQRLASNGYVVAVPNLYYRTGIFTPFDPKQVGAEGPERDRFKGMIASINGSKVMSDTAAVIEYLETDPGVRQGKIGIVGYCMGGGYALRAGGTFADRVGAAASFHGGSLATDKPDSPHLVATRTRAKLYVGVAAIDPTFPEDQQDRLEKALNEAHVDYTIETYENARHGFAVTGHLVYDRDASERHWQKLTQLFKSSL